MISLVQMRKSIKTSKWGNVSKGGNLFTESIKPPAVSNNSLAPSLGRINTKIRINFNESCLKQEKTRGQ